MNLLTNAGDAMPTGGHLTLRIASAVADDGRPDGLIEFADTGVGIPPENLEKSWNPSSPPKKKGKERASGWRSAGESSKKDQGDIQISSELGKGTTVRIVLPVKIDSNVGRIRGAQPSIDWSIRQTTERKEKHDDA